MRCKSHRIAAPRSTTAAVDHCCRSSHANQSSNVTICPRCPGAKHPFFASGASTPVTAVKKWAKVPNGHLLPYECSEEGWIKHLEELEKKAGAKK